MELTKDKELTKFFDHYAERMLPADDGKFMAELKRNIATLPTPATADKAVRSEDCTRWLLEKVQREYKRTKTDDIIACVLTSITLAAIVLLVGMLGILKAGIVIQASVCLGVAVVAVACIHGTAQMQTGRF